MNGLAIGVTAAVAFVVRWIPFVWERPYARTLVFVSALSSGMATLDRAVFAPTRHWHWLPLIVLVAWPLATWSRNKTRTTVCSVVVVLYCFVSSWSLVPNWSDAIAPRELQVALLAVYLSVGWYFSDRLVRRINSGEWILVGIASLLSVSLCVTVAVSMHYGQLGFIALTAMSITVLPIRPDQADEWLEIAHGPIFMATASIAWVGLIEPQRPMFALAFLPTIPLCGLMWPRCSIANTGPAAGRLERSRWGIVLTLLLLAAAVVYVLFPFRVGGSIADEW